VLNLIILYNIHGCYPAHSWFEPLRSAAWIFFSCITILSLLDWATLFSWLCHMIEPPYFHGWATILSHLFLMAEPYHIPFLWITTSTWISYGIPICNWATTFPQQYDNGTTACNSWANKSMTHPWHLLEKSPYFPATKSPWLIKDIPLTVPSQPNDWANKSTTELSHHIPLTVLTNPWLPPHRLSWATTFP
jgi:hypothetical protein